MDLCLDSTLSWVGWVDFGYLKRIIVGGKKSELQSSLLFYCNSVSWVHNFLNSRSNCQIQVLWPNHFVFFCIKFQEEII